MFVTAQWSEATLRTTSRPVRASVQRNVFSSIVTFSTSALRAANKITALEM